MTTLYGIKTCSTVAKARQWLDAHAIPYRFHDFRADGLDADTVRRFLEHVPNDTLLNKRSTPWKNLSDAEKTLGNNDQLVALLLAHPTLIKRPVLDTGEQLQLGFSATQYHAFFNP